MTSYQKSLGDSIQICKDIATFKQICAQQMVNNSCKKAAELKRQAYALPEDSEERKKLLDEASNVKKHLPLFCFNATYPDGKRRKESCVLTGLCFADFDGMKNPKEVLEALYAKYGGKEVFVKTFKIHLIKYSAAMRGFHIVFEADPEVGNLADNLQKLDAELGLKHDEQCEQSNTACFASPLECIEYIDDKLFTFNNPDYDKKWGEFYRKGEKGKKKYKEGDYRNSSIVPAADITPDSEFYGHTYREIQEKLWDELGGYPQVGNRHGMYMKFFAIFRFICDNKPDMLKAVFVKPENALSDSEIDQIIRDACNYKYHLSVPKALQEVLNELGVNSAISALPTDCNEINQMLLEQFMPRLKEIDLPDFFKAVCHGAPDNLSIGMILASLVMLGTYLTGIQFKHYDHKVSRLTLLMFPIGKAASGKHFFEDLDRLMMQLLRSQDAAGRALEKEYKKSKERDKNKKDQVAAPEAVIRVVPLSISNSMLITRLHNAVSEPDCVDNPFHLHLYIFDTELATMIRNNKGGSWIQKNDVFCKAFHSELWGTDYKNDQSVNGEVEVNINMVITGTEEAFDKFIPDSQVRDGLATRLIPYMMPFKPFQTFQHISERTEEEMALIQGVVADVSEFVMPQMVEAKALTDAMLEWCDGIAKQAEESEDYELDDLRKRTALIGERAGVIYAIVKHLEDFKHTRRLTVDEDCIKFAKFVADFTLQSQYIKFAGRMKNAREQYEQNVVHSTMTNWKEIYDKLPQTFTTKDLQAFNPTLTAEKINNQCRRWAERGKIRRLFKGNYEKLV